MRTINRSFCELLLDKKFQKWLDRATTNEAYCKWCRIKIHPKLSVTEESKRHKNFETSCSGSNKLSNYFGKEGALRNETRRAEFMITAFLIDHNIPFRVMDNFLLFYQGLFQIQILLENLHASKQNQPALPIMYLVKSSRQN